MFTLAANAAAARQEALLNVFAKGRLREAQAALGKHVNDLHGGQARRKALLDIDEISLSERAINRADILLRARPLGGLLMVDKGEADDKIVAVIEDDPIWGDLKDLSDVPAALVERLKHYFMTYKIAPGGNPVTIDAVYDREHARAVLYAAAEDYAERFVARS